MNTSLIRTRTSLQDSIAELLNKQIGMEAYSSAVYLAMSAWCYHQGFQGCGYYFKKQAGEEREHMMKIFDYVADVGGLPVSPEIHFIDNKFEGLRDIFAKSLDQEIAVTESFNHMTDHCHQIKDFQTAKFLQWILDEQLEEEQNSRRLLEIFDLIGVENGGLFKIDKEVEKLAKGE